MHSKLFLFLASYISKLNGIQILSRSFSPQRGLIKQLKIISSPTTTPLAGLYENHSVLIFLCLNKRSVGVCTTLISASSWSSRALLCDQSVMWILWLSDKVEAEFQHSQEHFQLYYYSIHSDIIIMQINISLNKVDIAMRDLGWLCIESGSSDKTVLPARLRRTP